MEAKLRAEIKKRVEGHLQNANVLHRWSTNEIEQLVDKKMSNLIKHLAEIATKDMTGTSIF